MPTNEQCIDRQREIYTHIGCRVKRWVFILVVGIGASVLGVVWRAAWVTAERAQAVEITQKLETKAVNARLDQHTKTQDKEYNALNQQMQKMDRKLDRVIEALHERR